MAIIAQEKPQAVPLEPLKAYLVSQPRRVRLFSKRLELVWTNRPDENGGGLTFGDGRSIPPKGPERDRWPVSLAFKGMSRAARLYPAPSCASPDDGLGWKVTAWTIETDGGTIAVEETEQVTSPEADGITLKKLDQDIEDLLTHIFEYLHKGTVTGPLRLSNPHLISCLEKRTCKNKDCPAYENPHVERCWEVTAFRTQESPSDVDILSKFHRCSECNVFDEAAPDSYTRIAENFNRLISLLQLKYQEMLDVQYRMQQADKLAIMGQLLGGIAHEIKNPLGIIIGRLDIVGLELESLSPQELSEDIATVCEQANRIRHIIDHLLDTARPEPPKFHPVHLNGIVMDSLKMVRKTLSEKRLNVVLDLQPDLSPIRADQIQMQQVLLNLILNARDAMADEGTLQIATRQVNTPAPGVEISVTDDGEGIHPDLLKRLFSSFQSTKINKGGTGLGLAVCHRIIESHGGKISAESTVNVGTTMHVWFPLKGSQA